MSESPSPKEKLKSVPHKPGVYLHMDKMGGIIYVGKAKDLRKRLSNYFSPSRRAQADRKTRALIETIADFDYQLVKNEQEAFILESKLIKQYRPRYNIMLRDDKRYQMMKVNLKDECPSFVMTRIKKSDGAKYFGPFVHNNALYDTMDYLNRRFGLRSCNVLTPGEKDYKHCNADMIRNCSAPCIGNISLKDYKAKVVEVAELLEGKGRREYLKEVEEEMQAAAQALDFEKAAKLRDVKENMEKTLTPTRQFKSGVGMPSTVQPEDDLSELGDFLGLGCPPKTMECFDISNVSSNHIVASMVRFTNGRPDNQKYRRYRIKTVEVQDDFASMAEVVRRRYSHILREGAKKARAEQIEDSQESPAALMERVRANMPDLIIVDGGKGQLSSAVKELQQLGLYNHPIIGLAKKREEVFFPGESDPLLIPHEKGALKLLQRIRDEAHRFANNYNELLLRKRITESILDDCPSVSPKKKELLLKKFGSVARLKKATPEQVAEIRGISISGAEVILEWLSKR